MKKYDIYDDRASKKGEIRPRYSGGSGGGGGCLIIPIAIIIEIAMVISLGVIFQLPDVLSIVISYIVCKRKYVEINYDKKGENIFIIPVFISFLIKSVIFIIAFSCSDGRGFTFYNLLCGLGVSFITSFPIALVGFMILTFKTRKS